LPCLAGISITRAPCSRAMSAERSVEASEMTMISPKPPTMCVSSSSRRARFCSSLYTGSSTLTEVSGPILAPTQEFSYRGATYTIMSINPGANSFTVFKGGFLFVNKGAAVTGGTGFMICAR